MISPSDILKANILIVDDQEAHVLLLERMLAGAGYVSIATTRDPHEVCELYRKNRYSLILLDLEMPSLDGFQVMEGLQAIETEGYLPVLAITVESLHKLRALQAGAKDFVGKPFDLAEVLVRVHNMIEVRLLHLETKSLYDRVVAEQKASEQLLLVFRSGPLAMSINTVADGRIIDANEEHCRFFGYSREEMVGRSVMELNLWANPEERATVIQRLLKEGVMRNFETKRRRKSGEVRDVLASLELIELAGENQPVLISMFTDITERRLAEESLRASQANMAAAQRIAHFGSWELELTNSNDVDAKALRWSDEMFRIAGYEPGAVEVSPELFFRLVHPDDREPIQQAVATAIRERRGYSIVHRLIRSDGDVRVVHEAAQIFFDEKTGQPLKMVGTAHDITEGKRSENALRESEERFRLLTKATNDAIWDWDLVTNALWWNEGFENLFGNRREDVDRTAKSWADYIHPEDLTRVTDGIHHVIEHGVDGWTDEYRFRCQDGRYAYVLGRGHVIRDSAGKGVRMIGGMQDITERKLSEAALEKAHKELVEAARQAGKAEVATSVLHNVGNVLNSVNVASSCLAESLRNSKAANLSKAATMLREHEGDLGTFLTSDPKGKQLPGYLAQLGEHLAGEQVAALKELAGLQKNIEHIKQIVTMQQSFAKVSGVMETLSVIDLLDDALRMNSSAPARHDIQIIKEFEEVPPISVDKHKVLQILVNLVTNARHACDNSDRSEKKLALRVTNGNDRVRIEVSDNGVGISPENLARIFGHGFTTKKDGHGFGLHSGALAAKEMGGSLTVQSEGVGKGAVFILELPSEPLSNNLILTRQMTGAFR